MCRTVPVLTSLRAAYRDARIDWLVQDSFSPAISAHPALSSAIPFPRRDLALAEFWRAGWGRALGALLRTIRQARYDLVIDAQGLLRSGLLTLASGGRQRVGFADARECGWIGYTRRVRAAGGPHTVDRMLALVEAIGVAPVRDTRLYTPEGTGLDPRLEGRRYGVLAPTSRWEGKRWPDDRFAALARRLLDSKSLEAIVIVGAAGERDQCPITLAQADGTTMVDLLGQTDVAGLMRVIERAALVVANDSAAVHMAVGFNRPLVALYGPTRIDLVGPYGRQGDVIQAAPPPQGRAHKDAARGRAAMEAIGLEQVERAALERVS